MRFEQKKPRKSIDRISQLLDDIKDYIPRKQIVFKVYCSFDSGIFCEILGSRPADDEPCERRISAKETFQRNKDKLVNFHKKFCRKGRLRKNLKSKVERYNL